MNTRSTDAKEKRYAERQPLDKCAQAFSPTSRTRV